MDTSSTTTKRSLVLCAAFALILAGVFAAMGALGAQPAWADDGGYAAASSLSENLDTQAPPKGPVPNGDYVIESKLKTKMVVDVKAASTNAKANVLLDSWDFSDSEKWRFLYHKSGGYYTIANVNSGMVLGVKNASKKNRANVIQQKPTGEKHQRWLIKKTKKGYRIQSALKADFVLDVDNAKTKPGTNIRMYKANGTTAQRFALIPCDRIAKPSTASIADGAYIIKSSKSGKAVAIAGESMNDYANVIQKGSGSSYAQRFYFESDGKGYYRIINIATGFSLQLENSDIFPGTNVVQSHCDAGDEQLWAIWTNSDGSYRIVPKIEGLHGTLEVKGASNKSGANIQVNTWAKTDNQKFKLTSVPLISDGVVMLRSAKATGKVLDVSGTSTEKGAKIGTYDYNATVAQKYFVTHDSKGRVKMQAVCSGYYVTHDGGNIVQGKKQSAWTVSFADSGVRRGLKFTNNAKTKALSLPSTKNGARAELLYSTGSAAQRFLPQTARLITNGYYVIDSATGDRKLDIYNNSSKNGTNIQIYEAGNSAAQTFKITHAGKGYYRIAQVKSGKCIEVADGSTKDGANVQLNAKKKSDSQLWLPAMAKGGTFTFTNKASGKLLTVKGNKDANNANVVSSAATGKSGQRWRPKAAIASAPYAREHALAKIANKVSSTKYLIAVDLKNHYTIVFKGSKGNWQVAKTYLASTGTTVPTTDATLGVRNYSANAGKHTYYYTSNFGTRGQFCSVPYKKGTMKLSNGTLGKSHAGTTVRLPLKQAKWIYDHIPNGTKVVVYK